jgi:hypothetical protein
MASLSWASSAALSGSADKTSLTRQGIRRCCIASPAMACWSPNTRRVCGRPGTGLLTRIKGCRLAERGSEHRPHRLDTASYRLSP